MNLDPLYNHVELHLLKDLDHYMVLDLIAADLLLVPDLENVKDDVGHDQKIVILDLENVDGHLSVEDLGLGLILKSVENEFVEADQKNGNDIEAEIGA